MKIYQVDAFTNKRFKGNPAAVCVLPDEHDADDNWMQNLAAEMNLSETAFVSKILKPAKRWGGVSTPLDRTVFSLRWFTPTTEVDLCGHATLATSHILWQEGYLEKDKSAFFDTLSGRLEVMLDGTQMVMNFPTDRVIPCKEPVGLEMALDCPILGVYETGQDLLVEIADEKSVANLNPVIQQIATLPVRCVIVTAKGNTVDFVSRVFGPAVGIDEDPVTGSTHCSLTPFWAERLGKTKMSALQLSKRGGVIGIELLDSRVNVSGEAVTVFKGELCG